MDALIVLLVAAITISAGAVLVAGDPSRVGVAGTLLGGVLGFATAFTIERYRRRHEDAHRFEQERRAVYVRLLEAVAEAEEIIRSRRVPAWIKREHPELNPEMPDRPDLKAVDLLADEVEILAPFRVYAAATLLRMALSQLDDGVGEGDQEWFKRSGELTSARSDFLKRAKADLGTPTGVMTRWQERRYRVKKRFGLALKKRHPTPVEEASSEAPGNSGRSS
jgi:hypothetical protein